MLLRLSLPLLLLPQLSWGIKTVSFKKITGMTLRQYRTRYLNDDFVKESMNLELMENDEK